MIHYFRITASERLSMTVVGTPSPVGMDYAYMVLLAQLSVSKGAKLRAGRLTRVMRCVTIELADPT